MVLRVIKNDNPDKGTETDIQFYIHKLFHNRLKMITPIRGRKQVSGDLYSVTLFKRLKMITPIRGRKLVFICGTFSVA